jgi:hypothetical protein
MKRLTVVSTFHSAIVIVFIYIEYSTFQFISVDCAALLRQVELSLWLSVLPHSRTLLPIHHAST